MRKVKPIWVLLKQETVSGSGIGWAICKSAPRSRQTATPVPHHSVFTGRMPFLPPNQQRQSAEGMNICTDSRQYIFVLSHTSADMLSAMDTVLQRHGGSRLLHDYGGDDDDIVTD